jgi:hypothetical protein
MGQPSGTRLPSSARDATYSAAHLYKEERGSKMHEVSVEGRFVSMEPNGAGWRICANGRYSHVQ